MQVDEIQHPLATISMHLSKETVCIYRLNNKNFDKALMFRKGQLREAIEIKKKDVFSLHKEVYSYDKMDRAIKVTNYSLFLKSVNHNNPCGWFKLFSSSLWQKKSETIWQYDTNVMIRKTEHFSPIPKNTTEFFFYSKGLLKQKKVLKGSKLLKVTTFSYSKKTDKPEFINKPNQIVFHLNEGLISRKTDGKRQVHYFYDAQGRLTKRTSYVSNTHESTYHYVYNRKNQLVYESRGFSQTYGLNLFRDKEIYFYAYRVQ